MEKNNKQIQGVFKEKVLHYYFGDSCHKIGIVAPINSVFEINDKKFVIGKTGILECRDTQIESLTILKNEKYTNLPYIINIYLDKDKMINDAENGELEILSITD